MQVIACNTPYGQGGLGQHFAQLVEEARAAGTLQGYYSKTLQTNDECIGQRVSMRAEGWIHRYTPVRFSPSWKSHVSNALFDRRVAAALTHPVERFTGFVGQSLHSLRRAAGLGSERLQLVTANSHVDNLKRRHAEARRQTGIDDGWLNEAQRRKTLEEYEWADVIHVHSEYVRQSYIDAGVAPDKLERMNLYIDDRFEPLSSRSNDDVFRVVYVGRIEATKGIPLLIEAFSRLSAPKTELTLIGGWSTRKMHRYMQEQMEHNSNIRVAPGDPLPALQRADVFVHPTYEDGFGYAPMEALACGIPVVVTEDTGMKEYVREGVNGYIVPTGSWEALLERIEHLRRHPLVGSCDLRPPAHPAADFIPCA